MVESGRWQPHYTAAYITTVRYPELRNVYCTHSLQRNGPVGCNGQQQQNSIIVITVYTLRCHL